MKSFSLVIEYLTGYAVATDPANREQAEWPPHPARVFMALAAAHFETDGLPEQKQAGRAALEWLATLDPPDVTVPQHTLREVRTVYVPVNDQAGGDALLMRSRQPRFFPRVHIGSEPLRLTWHAPDDPPANHLEALESICRSVTRIGHSSSLVWVRLERNTGVKPTHVPDEHALEKGLRIAEAGALQRLEYAFNKSAIEEFTALEAQISASNGKAKKQLQEKLKERFPRGQPTSQRPVFSISRGYRPIAPPSADTPQSPFDPNFIVLRESDDATQTFGLESTALVTDSLRQLIMQQSTVQPVPPWVGGHEPNGDKLTSQNHMALIPLAFVGRHWVKNEQFADGHLMGLGIVLPRDVSYRERAKVLSSILFDEKTNEPKTLPLTMGKAGAWKLVRETDLSPKRTLQTLTYTATGASWASVTPVLLDRMPKADRLKDPCTWREEVKGIIIKSCENVGLPAPIAVRVEKTPFFLGSLRAMPGQGGFPQLRKGKFQVHVAIEFDRPVQGPVLLGAGRFRGYGLMRPWENGEGR
ncbi:MAG TPA: type I-U CRISPR-associated protein Csb2 [Tepidisphaeraceae bacterium]|nr:type I-U CRISPR-associated protein Csb2 [Tepidisphaeraceae bacterium]